jgi:hypothetical protein
MRVFKLKDFARTARREGVVDADLLEAVQRAANGLTDGEIGKFLVKQRIPRQGQGRATGLRAILVYKDGDRAIFVFLFPKNSKAALTQDEEDVYRKLAKAYVALNEVTISSLLRQGKWIEISHEGQEDLSK